jgi:GAF domain-containing protein
MRLYPGVVSQQQGQAAFRVIVFIALLGLATSVLSFLRYDSALGADPILIFLLFAYPFLIGATIYFHLEDKKTAAILQDEYYVKWYLQSFAKTCLTETDQQILREELTGTLLRLIRPALVMVYALNPDTERLEIIQQAGIKNLPAAAGHGYTFGEGIPGWVMQNQNTAILADISKEQYLQVDAWAKSLNLRSFAAVPIVTEGKAVGVVAMYSFEAGYFQDSNLLVAQLAVQLYGLGVAASHATPSRAF